MTGATHVLTVDVECPARIIARRFSHTTVLPSPATAAAVTRVLGLLDAERARATFFVVATVAARFPRMVRAVQAAGHEIALHGWDHEPLSELTPARFTRLIARGRRVLEDIVGAPVAGYRSPFLSLRGQTWWSLEILRQEGFIYDSSAFPMLSRAGRARMPAGPFRLPNGLVEIPAASIQACGFGLPAAGGGYFRHLPYRWTSAALRQASRAGRPACVYVHPYEFDTGWSHGTGTALPLRGRLAVRAATLNAGARFEHRFVRLLREWHFQLAHEAAASVLMSFEAGAAPALDTAAGDTHLVARA